MSTALPSIDTGRRRLEAGVLVVGDSKLCDLHIRAWNLSGVRAERLSEKRGFRNSAVDTFVDICESNNQARANLIEKAIRSRMKTILVGPISSNFKFSEYVLSEAKKRKDRIVLLNPMTHHPLLTNALTAISNGSIGIPRILRIESKNLDKDLSGYSLFQGLFDGISALEILLGRIRTKKLFSRKVMTDNSIFYVSLLDLEDGSVCHLVSGTSSLENKLEFSVNGTGGLITFNKSDALSSSFRSGLLRSTNQVELLFHTFFGFLKNGTDDQSHDLYRVANMIEKSAS
ncbi:MAG: hypothetical protein OK439_06930 [Thaumarchaeota archaeon]|nr:hypothetical protein [Nitrososphaerota archaeon]